MKRAVVSRTADEVAALWLELGWRPLFFAIRSGRRDIPVSVALVEGAHQLRAPGHDPFQDFELLSRLLAEGRLLSRDGFMRWSGNLSREAALWRATKRLGDTCFRFGYGSPEQEFAAKKRAFRGETTGPTGERISELVEQAMADHERSRRR